MSTATRSTLADYLALPETKPYREYMDGEVIEKAMPNPAHSHAVVRLITLLASYQQENDTFEVMTEVRHIDVASGWVFLPDVSATLRSRLDAHGPLANPLDVLPDFAIEVLSPEDRPGAVLRRAAHYQEAGVTLLWVVDPEALTITVWERGQSPFEADSALPLSAAPVLPGFTIDVATIFRR